MTTAGERLGNWAHVPCDWGNFSEMSLVQCPKGRELPCLSSGPKQCTVLQGSRESCQVRASEAADTDLMSLPPHSPGTSVHQPGSQAWPAPHCQGESCTKRQEVSCAAQAWPRHHSKLSSAGRGQKESLPWGGGEQLWKGLTPAVLPSESLPNACCRRTLLPRG